MYSSGTTFEAENMDAGWENMDAGTEDMDAGTEDMDAGTEDLFVREKPARRDRGENNLVNGFESCNGRSMSVLVADP